VENALIFMYCIMENSPIYTVGDFKSYRNPYILGKFLHKLKLFFPPTQNVAQCNTVTCTFKTYGNICTFPVGLCKLDGSHFCKYKDKWHGIAGRKAKGENMVLFSYQKERILFKCNSLKTKTELILKRLA
jgi:hypothetical protein